MTCAWVQQLFKAVSQILPKGFVGKVELNCVNGAVRNIVISQSHKEENST